RPPDVFVDAQDYVYGVWYGVRGSNATVSLESNGLVLPPTSVALRPGRVSTIRTDLSRKATLKGAVRAPEKSFDNMQVIIRRIDGTEIRNATIGVDESVETLVPPEAFTISLIAGNWQFRKIADLSDGADHEVEFALDPITITGTVYYGKQRSEAHVSFSEGPKELVNVDTDDNGNYSTTLWRAGLYIAQVALRGRIPFVDPAMEITTSGTHDFHLPKTNITVSVKD